jgi:hypothetical protein
MKLETKPHPFVIHLDIWFNFSHLVLHLTHCSSSHICFSHLSYFFSHNFILPFFSHFTQHTLFWLHLHCCRTRLVASEATTLNANWNECFTYWWIWKEFMKHYPTILFFYHEFFCFVLARCWSSFYRTLGTNGETSLMPKLSNDVLYFPYKYNDKVEWIFLDIRHNIVSLGSTLLK